jgi:hypothetical protein
MESRGTEYGDVTWIHLGEDRDKLWALVNTVMNFGELHATWNILSGTA